MRWTFSTSTNMKVFLTGASGRIGAHIIPHLVTRGHSVTGLVRSQVSADKIKALGATPLIGTLDDNALLTATAKTHDAVIHCAYDHRAANPNAESKREYEVLKTFGDALEGSGKRLIMSGGLTAMGSDGVQRDEHYRPEGGFQRTETANMVSDLKDRGIASIVVRLATLTHSVDSIHGFMRLWAGMEAQLGYIPYVNDGSLRWTACNATDAGLLYVLALEKANPGMTVHAVQELVPTREIAETLAKRTGKRAGSVEENQLGKMGFLGGFLGKDTNFSTSWTRETFGWHPSGQTLLDEIASAPEGYI